MSAALRGDVWLVDLGEPIGGDAAGHRPAAVVSANGLNRGPAGVVVVVPGSTTARGLPTHVEVEPGESGLPEVTYLRAEDVRSISDRRLVTRLGVLPVDVVDRLDRVLALVLELGR